MINYEDSFFNYSIYCFFVCFYNKNLDIVLNFAALLNSFVLVGNVFKEFRTFSDVFGLKIKLGKIRFCTGVHIFT